MPSIIYSYLPASNANANMNCQAMYVDFWAWRVKTNPEVQAIVEATFGSMAEYLSLLYTTHDNIVQAIVPSYAAAVTAPMNPPAVDFLLLTTRCSVHRLMADAMPAGCQSGNFDASPDSVTPPIIPGITVIHIPPISQDLPSSSIRT